MTCMQRLLQAKTYGRNCFFDRLVLTQMWLWEMLRPQGCAGVLSGLWEVKLEKKEFMWTTCMLHTPYILPVNWFNICSNETAWKETLFGWSSYSWEPQEFRRWWWNHLEFHLARWFRNICPITRPHPPTPSCPTPRQARRTVWQSEMMTTSITDTSRTQRWMTKAYTETPVTGCHSEPLKTPKWNYVIQIIQWMKGQ